MYGNGNYVRKIMLFFKRYGSRMVFILEALGGGGDKIMGGEK